MSLKRADIFKVLIATLGVAISGSLFAQNYDNPGLGERPVAQHPQDYKPLGIRAGSFMLHPGVELVAQFTDNVFYTENGTRGDTIFHLRPYITAQSTWSRHSFNVSLAADIARHLDYDFRDYEDYFLLVNGRIDVRNRSFMTYGLNYMNLHESLNSRDSEQGFEPTRYDLYGANLGYDHTFNRLSLGGSVAWTRLDFDNAYSLLDGVIDNQDRDRDSISYTLRASYQFRSDMQAFASYQGYGVEYAEQFDRNGFSRNGDGYTVNAGVNFMMTGKLNGNLFASYNERGFDDPRLESISGWAGGAGLQWNPTYLTSVYGTITSSIEETTSQFASGYFRTVYSVRADHELKRFLQLTGFLSYSDNDYQLLAGAPDNARAWDEVFRAGIGLNWFINRHFRLSASYDYEKLKTNVANDGYDTNSVWLVLGYEY